ncbi:MAG: LamG domain-containing protein [Elusimicrobiota bacterium]
MGKWLWIILGIGICLTLIGGILAFGNPEVNMFKMFQQVLYQTGVGEINQGTLSIQKLKDEWIVTHDTESDLIPLIFDKNKQKTTICVYSLTANSKDNLPDLDFGTSEGFGSVSPKEKLKSKKIHAKDSGLDKDVFGYCFTSNNEKKLKFGNNSIITEYQEISTIQYVYEDFVVNTTLSRCDENRENCGIAYPDVLIVDSSKLKFGAEDTGVTNDSNYRYIFNSTSLILEDNQGYYLEGKTIWTMSGISKLKTKEKIRINTKDICEVTINSSNLSIVDFEPNCSFFNSGHYLEIYFTGRYNFTSNSIFIDPSYYIDEFTTTESYNINTTQENNFTHLDISGETPYNSLVLYVPFDDNQSTTSSYDYTGSNNDGTAVGNAEYNSSGYIGGGWYFDGNGDYIDFGDPADLELTDQTDEFTISVWVKPDIDSGLQSIAGKLLYGAGDLEFGIYSSGDAFYGKVANGTAQKLSGGVSTFSAGEWHHLVLTRDNTNRTYFYVDTSSEGSGVVHGSYNPTYNFYVGRRGSAAQYYFNGTIDELMVLNTSLSATQITTLYNNQSARFKNPGLQEFFNQSFLNLTGIEVNVTHDDYQTNMNSNLTLKIGYYDGTWAYTSEQQVTDENYFIIGTTYTNLTLNYTFYAGNGTDVQGVNTFYSPILFSGINVQNITKLFPYFKDTPQNQTLEYDVPLNYQINASASKFSVNDSSFAINSTGFLKNATTLLVKEYYLNISINNTADDINSTIMLVNITKAIPVLLLSITPTTTVKYKTETTATGSNCPSQLTCNLYRDGISKVNPEIVSLAKGDYVYVYNTTGNQNYTNSSISQSLTVTSAQFGKNLTVWKNASSELSISYIDNNGNWWILGDLVVEGTLFGGVRVELEAVQAECIGTDQNEMLAWDIIRHTLIQADLDNNDFSEKWQKAPRNKVNFIHAGYDDGEGFFHTKDDTYDMSAEYNGTDIKISPVDLGGWQVGNIVVITVNYENC